MTAADLVVTKPGGLSVSECLANGDRCCWFRPFPGRKSAMPTIYSEPAPRIKAVDGATLEFKLATLMAEPARLAAMSAAAARIARPGAAADVVCADILVPMKSVAHLLSGRGCWPRQCVVNALAQDTPPCPRRASRELGATVELDGVPNLFRITPTLYRSEQPTALGMKNLEKLGIRTIINLRWFHDDEDEVEGTRCAPSASRS